MRLHAATEPAQRFALRASFFSVDQTHGGVKTPPYKSSRAFPRGSWAQRAAPLPLPVPSAASRHNPSGSKKRGSLLTLRSFTAGLRPRASTKPPFRRMAFPGSSLEAPAVRQVPNAAAAKLSARRSGRVGPAARPERWARRPSRPDRCTCGRAWRARWRGNRRLSQTYR